VETVLLTGAAGFIGRFFSRQSFHLHPFNHREKFRLIETDLYDYTAADLSSVEAVRLLLKLYHPEVIVHLAASSKVGESGDINKIMLENLLTVIKARSYQLRLIVAGSAAEYGDVLTPAKETDICEPLESYAQSKLWCTNRLSEFSAETGCPVTVFRFANVYGPGQKGRFVPLVVEATSQGKPIILYDQGNPIRQFVYVYDICRALWKAVTDPVPGFEIINLGGPALSMKQMSQVVATAVHDYQLRHNSMIFPLVYDLIPEGGGAKRVEVDSSKAEKLLGWTPTTTLYDGIQRTVSDWFSHKGDIGESRKTGNS
jgi:UDP-glucose 4-epimerase